MGALKKRSNTKKMARHDPMDVEQLPRMKETKHIAQTSTNKFMYFIPFFLGTIMVDIVYSSIDVDGVLAICLVTLVATLAILYGASILTDNVTNAIADHSNIASRNHTLETRHAILLNMVYMADVVNNIAAIVETYSVAFVVNIGFKYLQDTIEYTEFDVPKLCTSFVLILIVLCAFVSLNRTIELLDAPTLRRVDSREAGTDVDELTQALG